MFRATYIAADREHRRTLLKRATCVNFECDLPNLTVTLKSHQVLSVGGHCHVIQVLRSKTRVMGRFSDVVLCDLGVTSRMRRLHSYCIPNVRVSKIGHPNIRRRYRGEGKIVCKRAAQKGHGVILRY